jgi:hypothetical protein
VTKILLFKFWSILLCFTPGGGGEGGRGEGGRPVSHGELMCGKLEGGGAEVGSYLAHCQPYTHNTHLHTYSRVDERKIWDRFSVVYKTPLLYLYLLCFKHVDGS